jgi:hypothetical protein
MGHIGSLREALKFKDVKFNEIDSGGASLH